MIPYGRQTIDDEDVKAVVAALKSDWLTTGPLVGEFETRVAELAGAKHGVAVSNGTAALHAAMFALGVGEGDEVIVASMTFLASSNAAIYQGATPVFVDVDPERLLIDPVQVAAKITRRTKAIVAVDYAGHPCDYDALNAVAKPHGIPVVSDACHALGGRYRDRPVGSLADITVFSFHPVKHITTGEGGMVVTSDAALARRARTFRSHGVDSDFRQREERGTWQYEMTELGYNYRLTDLQCALGISQLGRLPGWIARRREIASLYRHEFSSPKWKGRVRPLLESPDAMHAYHLFPVRVPRDERAALFTKLRASGIGVNVHYLPPHMHAYYRKRFGTGPGLCPNAEAAYDELLSLPMFPTLTDDDVRRVVRTFE